MVDGNSTATDAVVGPINYSPTTIVVISVVAGAFLVMFLVIFILWIQKKRRQRAYQHTREVEAAVALSGRAALQAARARAVTDSNAGASATAPNASSHGSAPDVPYLGTIVLPPGMSLPPSSSAPSSAADQRAASRAASRVDENDVLLNIPENEYDRVPSSASILTPAARASMGHRSRGPSSASHSVSSSKPSPAVGPMAAVAAAKSGWEEHVTSKGKHYWWNSVTGQTSWADPKNGIVVDKPAEDEEAPRSSTASADSTTAASAPEGM